MPVRCALALAALLVLGACGGNGTAGPSGGKIQVLTSISTFNSMVEAVGGSHVHVQSLVPVGASPENYEPTPQDVAKLAAAQLLIENGAGLESWLKKTIENAGSSNLRVVECSAGLPIVRDNPHLWMDPVYGQHYVLKIRDALMSIDPQHGEEYRSNARRYAAQLADLRKSIARKIATIPPNQRYMIVFHNAWQYYNARFGITTLGFIEANPGQDPNPQQTAHLIDLARAHHVRAIFSEPEYSTKLARQIASNANIAIVDNLYDDSIGTDPRVSTYIGMLNYDTDVIVHALK